MIYKQVYRLATWLKKEIKRQRLVIQAALSVVLNWTLSGAQ